MTNKIFYGEKKDLAVVRGDRNKLKLTHYEQKNNIKENFRVTRQVTESSSSTTMAAVSARLHLLPVIELLKVYCTCALSFSQKLCCLRGLG